MDMRGRLAKRLGSGAAWRRAQCAEHPEDDGNRRSADALAELAGHVMTLPADDHRIEAIAGLSFGEDPFSGSGDEVDQLIARYGANRHLQADPDTFLRELVGIADRNAQSSRWGGGGGTSVKTTRPPARRGPPPRAPRESRERADFDPAGGASDFDPAGGASDFDPSRGSSGLMEAYGRLSHWDFRPPHPMDGGPVMEFGAGC